MEIRVKNEQKRENVVVPRAGFGVKTLGDISRKSSLFSCYGKLGLLLCLKLGFSSRVPKRLPETKLFS